MTDNNEIQKLKDEIERLRELAYKDELTELFNRRGFKEESHRFINEVTTFNKHPERRSSFIVKNFSLVVFDIDDFKKLNDTHGHPAGDRALQYLAKLIKSRVREIDIIARWGGEEIILGLPGANLNDSFKLADDIRIKLKESNFEPKFTISGGVAELKAGQDFESLFDRADKALYEAKNSGKDKIVKFE